MAGPSERRDLWACHSCLTGEQSDVNLIKAQAEEFLPEALRPATEWWKSKLEGTSMFSGKIFGAVAGATVLALSATGALAQAKDKIKIGFIYVGPVGDHGWSYQHDQGRQAIEKAFPGKVDDHLRRERAGSRFRARHRAAGSHWPRPDLHDLFRLHGADPEGRQEVPEHQVRARDRLQARSEPLDLRGEVPRGPLHHRPDRRQDDQVEHHRLCGRLPDSGSDLRHQRLSSSARNR